VVVDAGGSSYWAAAYLELAPENQALYPRGAAAIGSALPMALGAQLVAPGKRMVCISGDGGFGYNIMEPETAVRLNLPVVNIVVNNHSLGMERRGYLEYAGEVPPAPVSFSPQNFRKSPRPCIALGPGRSGPATFVRPWRRPWRRGDRPWSMC
jgi:thiamine pyrophosphate-dependent acetolactate synthase large subunit-like protein